MNGTRLVLLLALAMSSACGNQYEAVSLKRVGGATDAKLRVSGVSVPVGHLVAFRIEPHAVDGTPDYDVSDEVSVSSTNDAVARVEPGVRADTWMVLGAATGEAELVVRINGETVERIPVDVEPQVAQGGQ